MVTDAQIGIALEAFDQKAGYSKIEKMRAALEAALSAAEPVGYTDASELSNDTGHGLFAYAQSDTSWLVGNPIALYTAAPALSAQVQDVAGWQLVPKKPTEEMEKAGRKEAADCDDTYGSSLFSAAEIYRAMLAAAPAKQEG